MASVQNKKLTWENPGCKIAELGVIWSFECDNSEHVGPSVPHIIHIVSPFPSPQPNPRYQHSARNCSMLQLICFLLTVLDVLSFSNTYTFWVVTHWKRQFGLSFGHFHEPCDIIPNKFWWSLQMFMYFYSMLASTKKLVTYCMQIFLLNLRHLLVSDCSTELYLYVYWLCLQSTALRIGKHYNAWVLFH